MTADNKLKPQAPATAPGFSFSVRYGNSIDRGAGGYKITMFKQYHSTHKGGHVFGNSEISSLVIPFAYELEEKTVSKLEQAMQELWSDYETEQRRSKFNGSYRHG